MSNHQLHFTGLNGLRAIAALAVLFSHTTLGLTEFGLNASYLGRNADGNPTTTLLAGFGVSMFFSLSGFLITYLLLIEKDKSEVNIKHFYLRRILRIFPLYYFYLTISILSLILFQETFDRQYVLFYILPLANVPFIVGGGLPLISHYWSLGVEEQFYLFWPWVVKSKSRLLPIAFALISFLILLKIALRLLASRTGYEMPYTALHVTRFHCMLIGCLGAIIYQNNCLRTINILKSLPAQLIAWAAIFLAMINRFHVMSVLDNELFSVFTVVIILGQIHNGAKVINLENKPMHFLGKISYGIYIYHPLVIFYLSKALHFTEDSWLNRMVVYCGVFTLTVTIAFCSYNFIEKRFLEMKSRFRLE
jgi:peptidoglycan/LPS O-acetylase OafA/YrhL